MANDLTPTDRRPPAASETRSSSVTTTLACSIPAWVDVAELDVSDRYGYGYAVPHGAFGALVAAARQHRLALTPPSPEDARKCLRGLRSATILQVEDAAEADVALKMLRVHLADVPLDMLETACHAYCNAPGRRFFPKSAGELREFINPLLHQRVARIARLEKLAARARAEQDDRERLAADPITPEGMAATMAEFGLRSAAPPVAARAVRAAPTVDDYIKLGLSPDEARQALTDRERLLRRGPARPIGDVAAAA